MSSRDGFPPAERVDVGGTVLSVHAAGPHDGPAVILLHGWPELAYSWKGQLEPLAAMGYRVIAPDGRGVGGSDAPDDVAAYGIDDLVGDVTGLIDWAGAERAVVVGHNWGGLLAWHVAMLRPDRVDGVASVNTPHMPRGERPTTESMRDFAGEDNYIVRFQEPGLAEGLISSAVDDFFRFIFVGGQSAEDMASIDPSVTHLLKQFEAFDADRHPPCVVPEEDRRVYVETYERTGFTGGLNWYRNMDANWERMAGVDQVVRAPSLMVAAERDAILPPTLTRWMDALVPDLEMHVLPGVGHWTQWEAPETLNEILSGWLKRRFPTR